MNNSSPHTNGATSQSEAAFNHCQERLMRDINGIVTDAEGLVRSVMGLSETGVALALDTLTAKLSAARETYSETRGCLQSSVESSSRVTQAYVTENPWRSIGVAATVGVALGFFFSRKR